jgi:hypothetical protein
MKLRTPSPALVISIVALCVALGGSAYAATQITSKQIKNGTIQNVDIKKGTIQSSSLSKGVQNVLSKKSSNSGASLSGSSVGGAGGVGQAYEAIRKAGPENQPANTIVTAATLTVPAGAYVVTANTIMTAFTGTTNPLEALFGTNGSLTGSCTLDAGGVTQQSLQTIAVNDRQTPATLGMQLTRTVGAPMDVKLNCSATISWRLSETSIIATRVGGITLSEVKG